MTVGTGLSQVARQGDPAKAGDPNAFRSPMVVETIFAASDRSLWKKGGWFTVPEYFELRKFSCDGVFLKGDSDRKTGWGPAMEMKARDFPGGNVEIKVDVWVNNPKRNLDKMVQLVLEVVNGDAVAASETVRMKAEDNGEGYDQVVKMTMPTVALQPTTKLRITMTTQNY